MAKVVQSQQQVIVEPWWAKGQIIYIGLGMGLLWWVLTAILRQYVVEPIACRDLSAAASCINAVGISGSIAAVLVAVAGTWALIRYLQPRPIIISVATLILLWDLSSLVNGMTWWATLLAALFFYTASYGLFSMVARIRWMAWALTLAAVIVVGIRLLLVLY
ncbi:hypothetical protein BGO17_01145 [Candidatus Saccharibacteria bacterium 49-20]|nr:MAG: hypothetical protein BGO17_01145 [Candidatus Saccharibacteria bacterium 49-20]